VELLSDVCLISVGLMYWLPEPLATIAPIGFHLFLVGTTLFVGIALRSFQREIILDSELDIKGKLFVGITGSIAVGSLSAPLLLWGFKIAVMGQNGGT
jgi:hypothetical protein